MATVVVAFPSTGLRVDAAEVVGSKWTTVTGAKSASAEDNYFYQGSICMSAKVSKGTDGVGFDDSLGTANTEDLETTPKTVLFKIFVYSVGVLDNQGATGVNLELGSGGGRTAFYQIYASGLDTWPATTSWLIIPWDPNLQAYWDEITSTPDLALVDFLGVEITTSGVTIKSENVGMDAYDYIGNGVANLLLTRGDSTDADGVYQDFIDFDEGTSGNRYGVVTSREGVLFVAGTLGIAESATATSFTDSNVSLIWPDGKIDTAFSGLLYDLGNASTVVTEADNSFVGRGRAENIQWFDTALDVDGTNEELDIIGHGYETGDFVLYSEEGGADSIGLSGNGVGPTSDHYWVEAVTVDSITLHATRAAAFTPGAGVGLTAASAPGENHKLTKEIDTRATITYTGTSGSATQTGSIYNGIDDLVLTSIVTLTDCKMLNSSNITAATGAIISGLILSLAKLDEGVAALIIDDLDDLSGCDFTFNDEGHAIEVTATTGSPYDWDHVLSGYWSPEVTPNNGWEFSTAQAFTSEQLNTDGLHGFATGDPVFYNNEGGIQSIGLTNGDKYYVNVVDTDTVTVHVTKSAAVAGSSAINLTTSGSETQALYSSKAAVFNDSAGAITINVNSGSTPSIRNGTSASTTVSASVPITITCKNSAGLVQEGIRIRIEEDPSGTLVTEGTTNGSGVFSDSFAGSTPQAVKVIARLKGFKFNQAFDNIVSDTGLSVPFTMIRDNAVNRP